MCIDDVHCRSIYCQDCVSDLFYHSQFALLPLIQVQICPFERRDGVSCSSFVLKFGRSLY